MIHLGGAATAMAAQQPRVAHVIERAMERYGLALTASALRQLEQRIAAGEGFVLRNMPDGSQHRLVREQGVAAIAVWDPRRRLIVTFLPQQRSLSLGRTVTGQTYRAPGSETAQAACPAHGDPDSRFARRRKARTGHRRMNP